MSYSATVLADSPLAYYRMDDTTSTLADSSGHGISGTYTATYTQGVAGLVNDGDAATSFNSGHAGANVSTLSSVGTGEFSAEFWFKSSGIGSLSVAIGFSGAGYAGLDAFGHITFQIGAGVVSPAATYADNARHHVVFTRGWHRLGQPVSRSDGRSAGWPGQQVP